MLARPGATLRSEPMHVGARTLRWWITLVPLFGWITLGAISGSTAASVKRASAIKEAHAVAATKWHNCGTVKQASKYGYVSTNRVQARDGISCGIARHIGRHFRSGGYSYRGLACFYAPMGSGNPYWNWSCGKGTRGNRTGR